MVAISVATGPINESIIAIIAAPTITHTLYTLVIAITPMFSP